MKKNTLSPNDGDFQSVPDTIISEIVSYLPLPDKANLEMTGNHRIHNITERSELTNQTKIMFNVNNNKGTYADIRKILNEQTSNKNKLKKVEDAIKSNPYDGLPDRIDLVNGTSCNLKGVLTLFGSLTLTALGTTSTITGSLKSDGLATGLGATSALLGLIGMGYAFYSFKKLRKDESEKQKLIDDVNKVPSPLNRV